MSKAVYTKNSGDKLERVGIDVPTSQVSKLLPFYRVDIEEKYAIIFPEYLGDSIYLYTLRGSNKRFHTTVIGKVLVCDTKEDLAYGANVVLNLGDERKNIVWCNEEDYKFLVGQYDGLGVYTWDASTKKLSSDGFLTIERACNRYLILDEADWILKLLQEERNTLEEISNELHRLTGQIFNLRELDGVLKNCNFGAKKINTLIS